MSGPVQHVVYRAFDADDRLLYVGSTARLEYRMNAHRTHSLWALWLARLESVEYATEAEARLAEMKAIQTEHPRWNVRDRSYLHPDGPMESIYGAPHLRADLETWRNWNRSGRRAA